MTTISGEDWKKAFQRFEPNLVKAQITLAKERLLVIKYTKFSDKENFLQCEYQGDAAFGCIQIGDDGFYRFHPYGYYEFDENTLADLAHKLKAMNEAWKQKLQSKGVTGIENQSQ